MEKHILMTKQDYKLKNTNILTMIIIVTTLGSALRRYSNMLNTSTPTPLRFLLYLGI